MQLLTCFLFKGVTGSTKRLVTVREHLFFPRYRNFEIRPLCVFGILILSPGSLAYLPRKRAARHRGKVKRSVIIL